MKYQRERHKSNKLSDEERKELNDLDFVWEPVPDVVAATTGRDSTSVKTTGTDEYISAAEEQSEETAEDRKPAAVEEVAAAAAAAAVEAAMSTAEV